MPDSPRVTITAPAVPAQPAAAFMGATSAAPPGGAVAEDWDPVEKRRRQAEARAGRAAARAAARAVTPERNSEFSHLELAALRSYRRALLEEEDRVSYWRRILQARLDVVRAGSDRGDRTQLRPVLTASRVGAGRSALVSIMPTDDVPPLPDLAQLWDTTAQPGDYAALAKLEARLVAAETELSAYRGALHIRLDAATLELIARYHEDPTRCLVALPL